jgi:glycosyltransferase involved in cell wall biosynthesis
VGYDAGGIPEVCVDGTTGLIVPTGDRTKLAGTIHRLLRDVGLRQRLAQQGRSHALRRFDHRRMIDQLEAAYQRAFVLPGRERA